MSIFLQYLSAINNKTYNLFLKKELYGDKGAHTVAKKMGFGGVASENHMIPETEDVGSGEVEEENEIDQPSYQVTLHFHHHIQSWVFLCHLWSF